MQHCCADMERAVESSCETHPDRFDCPDALVTYARDSHQYGIIIHDGGSSSVAIRYCPWCGLDLHARKSPATPRRA